MDFRLVHREASDTELAWLDGQADLSRMATMRAMVRHEQATLLVEAKAVDNIYPLYGEVALASGGALAPALAVEQRHREKFTARLPRRPVRPADIAPGAIVQLGDIRVRLKRRISMSPTVRRAGFPGTAAFTGLRACAPPVFCNRAV